MSGAPNNHSGRERKGLFSGSTGKWLENGPERKMYFLLKMGIFHCHVSLLEGISKEALNP